MLKCTPIETIVFKKVYCLFWSKFSCKNLCIICSYVKLCSTNYYFKIWDFLYKNISIENQNKPWMNWIVIRIKLKKNTKFFFFTYFYIFGLTSYQYFCLRCQDEKRGKKGLTKDSSFSVYHFFTWFDTDLQKMLIFSSSTYFVSSTAIKKIQYFSWKVIIVTALFSKK